MRRLLRSFWLLTACCGAASATVINFDNLPNVVYSSIPANYAGLTWDAGADWLYWIGIAPTFVPHSGPNLGYFLTGNDRGFNFGSPVVFGGAWFGGNGNSSVRFDMFSSGALVASSAILPVNPNAMVFLSSGYGGNVDRVQIHVIGSASGWAMDDITFNAQASSVPEPGSFGLLIIGGRVFFILRRRECLD